MRRMRMRMMMTDEDEDEDEDEDDEDDDEIIRFDQIIAEEEKKKKDKSQMINITHMCDINISNSNSSSAHASTRVSPSGYPAHDMHRIEARMKANVARQQRKFAREQNDEKQSLWKNGNEKDRKKAAEAIRGQCACRHKLSKRGDWIRGHCPAEKGNKICGFSHSSKELKKNRLRNTCSYELLGCDESGKMTLECACAHVQIVGGNLENSTVVKKFLNGQYDRCRARPCSFVHHVPITDGGLRLETEEEFENRLTYKIDQPKDWGSFVSVGKGDWGPGKFYAHKKRVMTIGSSRPIITSVKTSTGQSYASRASRSYSKKMSSLPVSVDVIEETCHNCRRVVEVIGVKQFQTCKCSAPMIQWGMSSSKGAPAQQKQYKTLTRFAGLKKTGGTFIVHGEVNEIVNILIKNNFIILDDGRTVSVVKGKGKEHDIEIKSNGIVSRLSPLETARVCKGIFKTQKNGTVISYNRTHRWTVEWTSATALGKINITDPRLLWRRPIEGGNGNGFSTTIPHWVVKAILGQTKDAILTLQRSWRECVLRSKLIQHAINLTKKAEEEARVKKITEEEAREKQYRENAEKEVERMRTALRSDHPSLMVSPPATTENKRLNQVRPTAILVPVQKSIENLSAFSGQQDRSPARMTTTSIGFDWSAPPKTKSDDLETEVKKHFGKHGANVWEFFQEIGLSEWNDLEEFEAEFFEDAEVDGVSDFWSRKKLLKKKVTKWVNANKPSVYSDA